MTTNPTSVPPARFVIKIGTSTLTAGTSRLSAPTLVDLARQISNLRAAGNEVVLVTSGAVATGREALSFPQLPKDIPVKQMLAAVGQPRLMALYERLFGLYGITVAQVLLTRSDLDNRRSYLNARNTLSALLSHQLLPIVNENDTVATEEIRLGDNDNLSALVATLVDADTLILLTDQPGVFTADPRHDPAAQLISDVLTDEIPPSLWEAASGTSSGGGTGGMVTKLQAANLARRSGTTVIIARGSDPDVLTRLAAGEHVGTHFRALDSTIDSRRRFLLAVGAAGSLAVDEGAAQALRRGGSLLPVGVAAVEGTFERGDTVRILDSSGREIARGIVNYRAGDLTRLLRRHSDDIEGLLGYDYGDEAIHHNDLVLL
ncbi:MAG: glutamate 5-kinase [Anaerolineales bacterium]|nr:glutamate 5-kinase [Anaerolineales bacterium]